MVNKSFIDKGLTQLHSYTIWSKIQYFFCFAKRKHLFLERHNLLWLDFLARFAKNAIFVNYEEIVSRNTYKNC